MGAASLTAAAAGGAGDARPIVRPPAVRPGATIGIFAPASPVRAGFVEAGERELRGLGFRIRRSPRLFRRADYTAGSASDRLADFLELAGDDRIDALFCARGGYGSMDILPDLDPGRFRERPKAILGSSDATALLAFASSAGVASFHGPMVAQQIARGPAAWAAEETLAVLSRVAPGLTLPWDGAETLHSGKAEGVLRGGCLSLVAALSGTPFALSFRGALAVIEDIGAKPYQIERMFQQLRLSGALRGAAGIIFGQMPGCFQHPDQGYTIQQLLARLTEPLGIPAVYGFATGHTSDRPARTVPFETRARMDEDGLTLLEGAVA